MSNWCDKCGKYMPTSESHRCPPCWEVWDATDGSTRQDARRFHADDAVDAAEQWARQDDSKGDYMIVGGQEATVNVGRVGEDEHHVYDVTGETVARYHATRKDGHERYDHV